MFDLGWTELLLIGIVALIVVGPKDLPVMFRTLGKFTGRLKGMAREFSTAMNQAADEAGVNDINKTLRAATNPLKASTDALRDTVTDAVNMDDGAKTPEMGPETAKLSQERQSAKDKVNAAMAQKALERKAQQAADKQAENAATTAVPPAATEVKE